MAWTEAQDEELRRLVDAGESATNIALAMELTRNMVIGRVSRLGLKLKGTIASGLADRWTNHAKAIVKKPEPKPEKTDHVAPYARAMDFWPLAEGPTAIHFDDAKPEHCRMPLWGIEARTGMICGKPRTMGKPYCKECARRIS